MDLTESIVSKEVTFKGDFLTIESTKVILPNGKEGNRDIVRHPGAVAILAFLDRDTIILEKQFRVPINQTILEIPAGKLEKNEDIKKAAIRELEEETGYKAKEIIYLGTIMPAVGFCDEKIHIYKATGLYKGNKNPDEDEFIEIVPYKINKIKQMIKSGEIMDVKTIASLMYL